MDADTIQDLGRLIARYANDPATARQLHKLPSFALPADTESVVGHLLEKLDAAESMSEGRGRQAASSWSSPSPSDSGASMTISQSPHISRAPGFAQACSPQDGQV